MHRPLKGSLNPTDVDQPTDTYDTIEWRVHDSPDRTAKSASLGLPTTLLIAHGAVPSPPCAARCGADQGGYRLTISADILRGRYREAFDVPKPVPAGGMQLHHFSLPTAHHVVRPGHRIMVLVQSSPFALYDRKPRTYVNIHCLCRGRRLKESCDQDL